MKELVESGKTESTPGVLNNETVCKLINKYFDNSGCTVSKLEELNRISIEKPNFIEDVREAIDSAYYDSDITDGEILSLSAVGTMKDLFDNLSKNHNNASLIYYLAYKMTDYHNKINHCKEEIDKPKIMTREWPSVIWYQKYLCPDISHEFPYIKCTQGEISVDGEMIKGEMDSFVSDLEADIRDLFDINPVEHI